MKTTCVLCLVLATIALTAAEEIQASIVVSVQDRLPLPINDNVVFGTEEPEDDATTTTAATTTRTTTRPARPLFITPKRPVCKLDSECGRPGKVFCNRWYGTCHSCIRRRQLCRSSRECCKGMACLLGTCQEPIKPGRLGSRCKADRDCRGDACCARHWGQDVCKVTLREMDLCHPPMGGLTWSIHSHCHCSPGLYCVAAMEPYRIQIGYYILTFPYQRMARRCRPINNRPAAATTATTIVRSSPNV